MIKSKSAAAWIALFVAGCSSDSGKVTLPADVPGAGGAPTLPGVGPGASGAGSEGMGFGELDQGSEEGLAGPTCLGETRETEQIGLDLFIMLDSSGSMLDPLPGPATGAVATKWDSVRSALASFVQSPETAEIGVGLQYFPQIEAGVPFSCESNDQCGTAGPCSNSLCVVAISRDDDPADQNPPLAFLRVSDDGPKPCFGDADCTGPGEACRTLLGECVIPPFVFLDVPDGSFLNMNPDPTGPLHSPVCSAQADCAGLPGTTCDPLGVCDDLATFCTPNLACGGGACLGLPSTCAGQTKCDVGDYSTPAVAISAAPERSAAIVASLDSQTPNGLTPTGPALEGALLQAQQWAETHPDRQVVTLLVTDGFPTECAPTEIADIAALAQSAANAARPVRTFVVGVFSDFDLAGDGQARLDAVARAGDTERALIVNTAGDVTQDFLAALDAVRTTSLSCDFSLDSDAALDFERVNLQMTDAGGVKTALFNVGDAPGCSSDGNGWYYVRDAGSVPTQIRVCPGACEALQSGAATAELQVGCATLIR